jgi:hypothetical protein
LVIHAELMTHRVLSRNASSSRAIPINKMINSVIDDPFFPVVWTKDQPGMQGYNELTGKDLDLAKSIWTEALGTAVRKARALAKVGAHKQVVNRLLSPFAHITTLVSATEWAGWEAQRLHPAAEPHIQILAHKIKTAMDASTPVKLGPVQWHLPYVSQQDRTRMILNDQIRLSVARCASVSYKTVDDLDMTPDRALVLYVKLKDQKHMSPFEHQACIADEDDAGLNGNFAVGWSQYRKFIETEETTHD